MRSAHSIAPRNPRRSMFATSFRSVCLALALAALPSAHAAAQCTGGPCQSSVAPDGKGIVGLGLIGAEIGFIVPALVQEATNTHEWWPYLVFPVIGAAGGAVGGYFVEQATADVPEVDVALLAVGIGLVVPTLVGTLALTAYDPGENAPVAEEEEVYSPPSRPADGTTTEAVEDPNATMEPGPTTEPGAAPIVQPAGQSSSLRRRMNDLFAGGTGLLRFRGSQLLLGVPVIGRLATFTREEQEALHLPSNASDVNVPVISGTF